MTKAAYQERKAQGLCVRCGKTQAMDGLTYCAECADYYREARAFYHNLGYCTVCHKERIYGSERICFSCREKAAEKRKQDRLLGKPWAFTEYNNALSRKRYAKSKEQGLCVRCRKRKAEDGRVKCRICANKEAEYRRLHRAKIAEDKMGETA